MRTARPLVTWSRMTLWAPSASSLSISTPRLIGPGCMIRQSGFSRFPRSFVSPNSRMYSPRPGKVFLPLPLVLDAKEVNDVGRLQDFIDVVRNGDAQFFKLAGHQRARPDQGHARTELEQREDIGPRDAAKKDVANDRDLQAGDRALLRADGVKIEQRLGRMLVRAIASVDDARREPLRQELRRAGGTVPDHDDVGVVRFQDLGRVLERFALGQAGGGRGDVDDIRAQADRRDLERGAGARARFDEEIHQRFPAQGRHLLDLARADFLERIRRIEKERDLLRGKFADAEQILALPANFARPARSRFLLLDQPDRIRFAIHIFEAQTHSLPRSSREIFADIIDPDGELAVAAIDERRELDPRRPPEGIDGVHGGAGRPPGEKDVVHDDDRLVVQRAAAGWKPGRAAARRVYRHRPDASRRR